MKVKTCLRYPGGKFYGFKKIEKYLDVPHKQFVEVFVGGGSIFLGKEKVGENWINDKDENLINFYKTIQNERDKKMLFEMLNNESVSKQRYSEVLGMQPQNNIERAFQYFYLNRTSFSGIMNKPRWGYMIGSSVTPDKWIDRIIPVSDKIKDVKITCLDFREVLGQINNDALVYLDPPYYQASKGIYSKEFSTQDHIDLMHMLRESNFRFILSYNNNEDLYKMYDWCNIVDENWVYFMSENRRLDGKELIITNF
tara:strand:- start:1791 stop:2552 length:762 start_codon:yes stop_codon:yes gene_type:complete